MTSARILAQSLPVASPSCADFGSRKALGCGRPFVTLPLNKVQRCAVITQAKMTKENRSSAGRPQGLTTKQEKRTDGDRVPGDELTSSPLAYTGLAGAYALLALPALLFPHSAADFLFGAAAQPHDLLHEPLMRIFATGSLTASAVSFALKIAAKDQDLDASWSKRLEIGLIVFATVNALLQTTTAAQPDSVLTFPAFWSTAAVFGLTVLAAWGGYGKASEYGLSLKRYGPLPALKKFQDDTADIPQQSNISSLAYTLLTVNFFVAGLGYLYAPETTLQAVFSNVKGPECVFLWRAIGAALVSVVPVVSYSLKEGAQKGQLGDAPFKVMNIGLAGASLGHLVALAPLLGGEYSGPFLPALLGIWGTSLAVSGLNTFQAQDD